uniref:FAD-binding domain-containing protein n=1 Tax=Oryza glumipatula TaxID=40148 RepID=A0A0D9YS58_9ORYZ
MEMEEVVEDAAHGIVIVGGGICGLATALALHRKGISSLVLERSEALRADGVAIGIHANGWRALEHLGVAAVLREATNAITAYRSVWQLQNKTTLLPARKELRCLTRKDLVETLAKNLPAGTIRFGCRVAAVDEESGSRCPVLTTEDGHTIKAKVLIGCDGANSVVAKYLGLGNPSELPRLAILGLASYPDGHPFGTEFLTIAGDDLAVGRLPINDHLVHFFLSRRRPSTDMARDASAAREYVLEKLQECPADVVDMVRRCDHASSLWTTTKVWYRPPWQVALAAFFQLRRRAAVTVAGDAMHVMGPFIGQGGSSALEDAVVLARSLSSSRATVEGGADDLAGDRGRRHDQPQVDGEMGAAIGRYVRERRARVIRLSLESFTVGTLLRTKSAVVRLVCAVVMALLGTRSRRHADYDCGSL